MKGAQVPLDTVCELLGTCSLTVRVTGLPAAHKGVSSFLGQLQSKGDVEPSVLCQLLC